MMTHVAKDQCLQMKIINFMCRAMKGVGEVTVDVQRL
jgi:hypothetical protein